MINRSITESCGHCCPVHLDADEAYILESISKYVHMAHVMSPGGSGLGKLLRCGREQEETLSKESWKAQDSADIKL